MLCMTSRHRALLKDLEQVASFYCSVLKRDKQSLGYSPLQRSSKFHHPKNSKASYECTLSPLV